MNRPAGNDPGSRHQFDLDELGPGAAFLWLLLLAALFYAPILAGVRTFPDGDFTHHFLPFSLFHQAELLAGRLALWNPSTYAGHPFLADTQAAVFYPLNNVALLLTAFWRSAAARLYFLQVEAVLHVALAGFFTYLLARDLAGRRWAAFLAGACFAFSGYLTGYPPLQLAVLRTAVWLPLLLWLLGRAMLQPAAWRWWLAAAATYATALAAGHPQTLLHLTYAAAAWTLLCWTLPADGSRVHVRRLLGLTVALALAAGLSMAQLWPSVEYTRLSVRASVDYAFVSGGFPRRDVWQMLLPGVLTQFSPLYIGVAGLGLAAVAAALLFDRTQPPADALPPSPFASCYLTHRRRVVAFFFGLGAVALLLSFGDNGFLYPLFYRFAPGWNLFRGQERAAYLVAFALSVLAGAGAAALPGLAPRLRRRTALIFGGAVTAGAYAFGLLWQLPGRTAVGPWHYLAIAFTTLVLGLAVALLIWLPGWSRRRAYLLLALVAGNLFLANMGANLDPFGPARKVVAAPEVTALVQAVSEQGNANLGLADRAYNEYRAYEDYAMAHGVEDVWGSSPLRLARYAALFDQFPLDRMWDLTGVGHVLTWRRELFEPSALLAEFPQAADTTYLHRLADDNPRARLLTEARVVDDAAALALLADHGFDLKREALLSPDSGLESGATLGATGDGHASIHLAQVRPGHLRVEVNSPAGGLLAVAENWMPGWRVDNVACGGQPDGCRGLRSPFAGLAPLSVHRANLSFIGVPIPPGDVRFDLVYRPDSVRYGLWISGIALGSLIIATAASYLGLTKTKLAQRRKGAEEVRQGRFIAFPSSRLRVFVRPTPSWRLCVSAREMAPRS